MGPFLADPLPSPRRFTWFGIGLVLAFATSSHPATPRRSVVTCDFHRVQQVRGAPGMVRLLAIEVAPPATADEAAGYRMVVANTITEKVATRTSSHARPFYVRYAPGGAGTLPGYYLRAATGPIETAIERDAHLDVENVVVRCTVTIVANRNRGFEESEILGSAIGRARVTMPLQSADGERAAAREACVESATEDASANAFPAIELDAYGRD